VVEFPEILHRQIRISAAEENISLKAWLIRASLEYIRKNEELKNITASDHNQ
jgi:predicted HicB family RNase H-like nuclease